VQAYTHPLWLLVLAGGWGVTGEPYFSSLALSMACSVLAATVLAFRVARNWTAGALAVALLAVSRALVDYSTSGLENPLSHLLLALFLAAYWTADRSPRRIGAIVALGALAAVNRLDLGLLLAPALLHVALGARRQAWVWMAAGALPLVAWEAFSIVYYGFPFPNTAYAKLPPNILLLEYIPQGLTYLADCWRNDPVTVATIAFALLLTIVTDSAIEQVTIAAGLFAYLVYVVRVGGDFMSGRFLTAPFLVAVAVTARRVPASRRSPVLAGALLLVLLGGLTGLRATLSVPPPGDPEAFIQPTGIADERWVYAPYTRLIPALQRGEAPVTGSERSGQKLRRLRMSPLVWAATGFIGYGAGPDVFILDRLGLSDPLVARLPALHPWRIGHFPRDIPDGYLETAATGRMAITDPVLARYYTQLALITRGPIWSRERWKAILQVNLGRIRPTG
jgi:arabinofuranosyltransferase